MEKEINIAEILKNKSRRTKLYSSAFGQMTYNGIAYDENGTEIWLLTENKVDTLYLSDGKYREGGEITLYPSKEMRDWSKFAWKRGNVLISNDGGREVIFYEWYDDTYTNFYGRHYLNSENENNILYYESFLCTTELYSIEDKNTAQCYVNTIEERLGGKLNFETLEIEYNNSMGFKNGDIVSVTGKRYCFIEILNYFKNGSLYDYVSLNTTLQMIDVSGKYPISKNEIVKIRLATDLEREEFFEALTKKNKAWDAKKKVIIDLKPKWVPKPFDKVVARNSTDDIWTANIFSHIDSYGEYVTIACVGGYAYCLPYNEETAKLIGTAKEWKE